MMQIFNILADDMGLIPYRKELNKITGSVTATILLQQLMYWFKRSEGEPFYKFIEPCGNDLYNEGDSWTEELGFTRKEFIGAYKKLEDLGFVSKKITMTRVTYYTLNLADLGKALKVLYVNDKRDFIQSTKGNIDICNILTETTTETTTENIKNTKKEKEQKSLGNSFTKILDELKLKVSWKSKLKLNQHTRREALNNFIDLANSKRFQEAMEKTKKKDYELVIYFYEKHIASSAKYAKKIGDFLADFFAIVDELQQEKKKEEDKFSSIDELRDFLTKNFKRKIITDEVPGYKKEISFSVSRYGEIMNDHSGNILRDEDDGLLLNFLLKNPDRIGNVLHVGN